MLRTGWVVVRVAVVELDGQGGGGDQHGDGLPGVAAAEGGVLHGAHDHAGGADPALDPDRLGRGAWRRVGWAEAAQRIGCQCVREGLRRSFADLLGTPGL